MFRTPTCVLTNSHQCPASAERSPYNVWYYNRVYDVTIGVYVMPHSVSMDAIFQVMPCVLDNYWDSLCSNVMRIGSYLPGIVYFNQLYICRPIYMHKGVKIALVTHICLAIKCRDLNFWYRNFHIKPMTL